MDPNNIQHIIDKATNGYITVEAFDREGQKRKWILDLRDFLPFMSDPGFREQLCGNETSDTFATHNLYSSMAFWLFDSSFAANFFHNLSNYTLSKAANVLFLSDLKSVFIDSEEDTNMAAGKVRNIGKEETTPLEVIVDRGDLSWAPDPSIASYTHTKTGADLSLMVINKMKVSCY